MPHAPGGLIDSPTGALAARRRSTLVRRDAQGMSADVVELALLHQRVDARASDAKAAGGFDRR